MSCFYTSRCVNKIKLYNEQRKDCSFLAIQRFCCARSSKSSSFLLIPFIIRDNDVAVVRAVVRERELDLFIAPIAYSAFAEPKVTFLYELSNPMYCVQVSCTFFFDF